MKLRWYPILFLLGGLLFLLFVLLAISEQEASHTLEVLLSTTPVSESCRQTLGLIDARFNAIEQCFSPWDMRGDGGLPPWSSVPLQVLTDILGRCRLIALIAVVKLHKAKTLLEVLLMIWGAAVFDGLTARKIAADTFIAPRPAVSSVLQTISLLLPFCALAVMLFPVLGLDSWAMSIGLGAACSTMIWIRDFHRFG